MIKLRIEHHYYWLFWVLKNYFLWVSSILAPSWASPHVGSPLVSRTLAITKGHFFPHVLRLLILIFTFLLPVTFCFPENHILLPTHSQVLPCLESSLGSSILPAIILLLVPHDGLWTLSQCPHQPLFSQAGFLLALHVMKMTLVKVTIDLHDAKSNRHLVFSSYSSSH